MRAPLPIDVGRIPPDALARFWGLVRSADPDECWEWTGCRSADGYGLYFLEPRRRGQRLAHRIALAVSTGADPGSLMVMHTCDNPPCCNPKHLRTGTALENNRDCMTKGRFRAGEYKRKQTHCANGHPFDDSNTYWWRGRRACRICIAAASRRLRDRRRNRTGQDNETRER